MTTAAEVRARIAEVMLDDPRDIIVGSILLKTHQSSAVKRIEAALTEFGGALLCDEVGMGKTYVAAAIAHAYSRVLVVAPAGLATMWRKALSRTSTSADLVSFEKLSRSVAASRSLVSPSGYDLVIVDEAQHARNRGTHRYAQLQQLVRVAGVLLLSATPIHNRREEMLALLSLFLGDRAKTLTPDEIARCVIRREHHQVQAAAPIPEILPAIQLGVADCSHIVEALMTLPPAIAVRDGGFAQTLVGRGLVHQWASSEAALREALRKRIARATALVASLAVGTYPTDRELRAWTFADGAVQLGFAEFLATRSANADTLLVSVTHHRDALLRLLATLGNDAPLDAHRTDLLLQIRHAHPGEKIVAFAQYAATVVMLFRRLVRTGRIALLTTRGARVAGGKMSRQEVLARFAPEASGTAAPGPAEQIDLLLTTDLLSEGVNLQDAGVVAHLDLPWTAARMEQRVGRVARIGSTRSSVQAYIISPPPSAAAVLRSEAIVLRKWNVARNTVGATRSPPIPAPDAPVSSTSSCIETLRSTLEQWRGQPTLGAGTLLACVRSSCCGFIAAVTIDGHPKLVVELGGYVSTDIDTQLAACRLATNADIEMDSGDFTRVIAKLETWCQRERAASLAGTGSSTLRRRRLLNRIDRTIENAPPHSRATLLNLATRARRTVVAQHTGAVEAELQALARSDLDSKQWLAAVAQLEPTPPLSAADKVRPRDESMQIHGRNFAAHAILLLRQTPCS